MENLNFFDPAEIKVTVIHCLDPKCGRCSEARQTWHWLDEQLVENNTENLPAIIAVRDPQNKQLMVYDGNTRVAHARQNGYKLSALVIASPADLTEFLSTHTACWFGIEDWLELLDFMRIYAGAPDIHSFDDMSPESIQKIRNKMAERQRLAVQLHREEMNKLFGWHDDD